MDAARRLVEEPAGPNAYDGGTQVGKLAQSDALDWLDSAMTGAWKGAEEYRKTDEVAQLLETERGLQMALGAVDDQKRRKGIA